MFIHPVDTNSMQQGSVYEAVYARPHTAISRPLTLLASNSLEAAMIAGAAQPAPAAQSAAERVDGAGASTMPALWRSSGRAAIDHQARVLLKFVDGDAAAPAQNSLLAGVTLLLAMLAVFFSARIFGGTDGTGASS
jgi:hypothetical protein